jgi:hypothetical protein
MSSWIAMGSPAAMPHPHRSGFVIDGISAKDEANLAELITQCQSLVGGLTWLHVSTRPDIGVIHKLCCAHLQMPSSDHVTLAKQIPRHPRPLLLLARRSWRTHRSL